jgi:hypothetical protein
VDAAIVAQHRKSKPTEITSPPAAGSISQRSLIVPWWPSTPSRKRKTLPFSFTHFS